MLLVSGWFHVSETIIPEAGSTFLPLHNAATLILSVDWGQEVTSDPVGGTNSDTYGAGDMITFRVVFNQAVTVNGTPRLRFSITGGTGDEYATYVSGNGTNTLVFSYTVLATEMDSDGIYLYKNPLDYPDANVDSIVGTSNSLDAVNDGIGKEGVLSGHKVDGSLTN